MKRFYVLITLVLAGCLMVPAAFPQSLTTGDVTGTVTDTSGAVTPNVTVTLKSVDSGATRTTTTGSTGFYRFSLLSPGNYTITAEAQGFSKTERTVAVNLGQASVTDIKLQVGSTTQTVEVTTAAPLVNADNADLSTSFSQSLIQNEPNGGNDLTYIAQTAPGVTMNVGGGYGNFTANGLPATSNLFTVNGENDMDPYLNLNNSGATNLTLGKNELQEATVVSNAYSGQYGQQAGAQVNYVTKSGTNQYHGNVFYEWTGRKMDANDWFNKNQTPTVPRPFANNNQWGAAFGGPIKKDKLFFFVDYEAVQYIVPSVTPVYAPSPNYITTTLNNLNCGTGSPDPGCPLYQRYFHLFQTAPGYNTGTPFGGDCGAIAGGSDCLVTYQASPSLPGTEWILPFRIDWNFTPKDQLYFRARIDHGTQATYADPINSAFSVASKQPAYDGQFGWTHVFGPTATNQFSADLSHYQAIFIQFNPGLFPYGLFGNGINLTTVGGGGVYSFPQGRNVTQYQFIDDFSWSKGKHSLRFGGNFRRYDISDFGFNSFVYPRILVNSLADLSVGLSQQYRQDFNSRNSQPVALWGMGIYAQDEWKVKSNLTLTLALRLEKNSNPVCQTNCASLLDGSFNTLLNAGVLTQANAYNSIITAGRHQIFRSTDTLNVAPRFGFAWTPLGPDTVFRGGFGIFYDALPAFVGDQFMRNMPGVIDERVNGAAWADPATASIANDCARALQSGFSSGVSWNDVKVVNGFPCRRPSYNNQAGTFHTPYYEQWSLGIQQALGNKASISLGYIGNHGVHIPVYNEGENAYDTGGCGGPCYGGALPSAPPSNAFGVVQQYQSAAVSNYNGVTTTFNQRMTYGFTVQASYTWSHTMDDVSNGGTTLFYNGNTSLQYQVNPTCLRCNNYGNSDYNVSSSFNAAYVWNMPYKFSGKFANAAFGGWILSQNFFARTGLPYTLLDGFDALGNYTPTYPPLQTTLLATNQTCSNGHSQCVPFQDPTGATSSPAYNIPGITGVALPGFPTQRRNTYRGPGFFDSDVTIGKNFKLTERFLFNFTTNFYNVFNHPNFSSPDNLAGDTTFGQITTTTAPPTGPYGSFFTGSPSGRIIQFAGRITF